MRKQHILNLRILARKYMILLSYAKTALKNTVFTLVAFRYNIFYKFYKLYRNTP